MRPRASALLTIAAILSLAACGGGSGGGVPNGPTATTSPRPQVSAGASHGQAVRARLDRIGEAEMVAGKRGWALLGLGLYWTDDGGREWRQITPPLPHPVELRGAYFRDRRHGWALAEEGTEGAEHQVIFSTADGGRRWLRTPLRIERLLLPAASVSFSALDDRRVFALVERSGDTASNFGILFFSGDGGRSWRQIKPNPPQAGEIAFESRRDGWLASGSPAAKLWRTHDGGRHWAEVSLPAAPGSELDAVAALAPRIDAAGRGLLPAVLVAHRPRNTVAVVYSTRDHGRHWTSVERAPLRRVGGYVDPATIFSFQGPDRVLFLNPRTHRTFAVSAGAAERRHRARRLPFGARLSFSGPRLGFALSPFGRPPVLVLSTDGGAGWTPISRNPGQPRVSQ
jgi:photosystem II stability/assembly factor-like uncharacterized protein